MRKKKPLNMLLRFPCDAAIKMHRPRAIYRPRPIQAQEEAITMLLRVSFDGEIKMHRPRPIHCPRPIRRATHHRASRSADKSEREAMRILAQSEGGKIQTNRVLLLSMRLQRSGTAEIHALAGKFASLNCGQDEPQPIAVETSIVTICRLKLES